MLSEYGDFALNVKLVGKAGHVAQSGNIPRPVDRTTGYVREMGRVEHRRLGHRCALFEVDAKEHLHACLSNRQVSGVCGLFNQGRQIHERVCRGGYKVPFRAVG